MKLRGLVLVLPRVAYLGLGMSFMCISYVRNHVYIMCILYVCVVHRGLAAGIYATNNPEACHFVADNCKANIIVVENQKQLDKILEVSVAVTETYFCTSQVECRGLPMSVCLHDYQCLSA